MPVVRAEIILDEKACTLGYAFTPPNGFNIEILVRKFLRGDYPLVQKWLPSNDFPALQEILATCYTQRSLVKSFERGNSTYVQLLSFSPHTEACFALRRPY